MSNVLLNEENEDNARKENKTIRRDMSGEHAEASKD